MLYDSVIAHSQPCPKCTGKLLYRSDQFGHYIQCINCGKTFELPTIRPLSPAGNTPSPAPLKSPQKSLTLATQKAQEILHHTQAKPKGKTLQPVP